MVAERSTGPPALVWDAGTRLFHWPLVLLIPFSWWSATNGHLLWHRLSGYTVLALLIFRLVWGFVGSQTARFTDFIRGPSTVIQYVRGRGAPVVGHSPLGALSVLAMIGALVAQVALGLFAVDEDGLEPGPLSKYVDFDTGRIVAKAHHLTLYVLLGLIVLHVVAIAIYELRGKRLVGAMVTGKGALPEGVTQPRFASAWTALAIAVLAGALAWFLAHGLRFIGPV
jgi:cytochrome b